MNPIINPYIMPGINYMALKEGRKTPVKLTLSELDKVISDFFKVETIKGNSRKKNIVYPKHVFCYISYSEGYTYETIGMHINRTHVTVINSVNRISGFVDKYPEDKLLISDIRSNIAKAKIIKRILEEEPVNNEQNQDEQNLFWELYIK